jgi:hypothetical protein
MSQQDANLRAGPSRTLNSIPCSASLRHPRDGKEHDAHDPFGINRDSCAAADLRKYRIIRHGASRFVPSMPERVASPTFQSLGRPHINAFFNFSDSVPAQQIAVGRLEPKCGTPASASSFRKSRARLPGEIGGLTVARAQASRERIICGRPLVAPPIDSGLARRRPERPMGAFVALAPRS